MCPTSFTSSILRGTRMKIDEPDTPFHGSPDISDDDPEPMLGSSHQTSPQSRLGSLIDGLEQAVEDDEHKKKEFQERRKAHYNEIQALRSHLSDTDSSGEYEEATSVQPQHSLS
jgi:hypothetical protein